MDFIRKIQIKVQNKVQSKTQIKALLFHETFIAILTKYSHYNNFLLIKNIIKFFKYIKINNHAIILKESKQSPFKPIYNLKPVELKILIMYIKISLINSFIQLFRYPSNTFILFN